MVGCGMQRGLKCGVGSSERASACRLSVEDGRAGGGEGRSGRKPGIDARAWGEIEARVVVSCGT
jgi:hypothetical protein